MIQSNVMGALGDAGKKVLGWLGFGDDEKDLKEAKPGKSKAMGGPIGAGVPVLVGEHGPELFVPSASGRVLPKQQTHTAMGGAGGGNYYGDGSDGAFTTTGDVTYTVLNKSGSYDGDMVVKNYTSLTIGAGHTITTDQPCRGMLIYVKGDCSISGTLNARIGAFADPTNTGGSDSAAVNASGIRLPMLTASGTDTLAAADFAGSGTAAVTAVANQPEIAGDGTIFQIVKIGAVGGNAHGYGSPSGNITRSPGTAGAQGTTTAASGQCGGGATGGYQSQGGNSGFTVQGATGGLAGTFSGGAGGGGF